jgi:hypothetical protein
VKAAAEGFEEGLTERLSLADLLPGRKFELALRRGAPEPPGNLRGRVLYDTGQAFTGVITLSFHRQGRAGQIRRVTTDETGAYAVEGILPGEYVLRSALRDRRDLSETGRTILVPAGGEAEADLVVPRGGDVAVSATTAAGEPAKGARVEVLDEQGAVKFTYEAPEGGVRIYDLPPGMATLRISAQGFLAQVVEAPVARDQEAPVSVRLEEDR